MRGRGIFQEYLVIMGGRGLPIYWSISFVYTYELFKNANVDLFIHFMHLNYLFTNLIELPVQIFCTAQ